MGGGARSSFERIVGGRAIEKGRLFLWREKRLQQLILPFIAREGLEELLYAGFCVCFIPFFAVVGEEGFCFLVGGSIVWARGRILPFCCGTQQ